MKLDVLAIVLGLFMAGLACRSPKPVEAPQNKPRIVIQPAKPCLAPPPELPTLALPDVAEEAVEVRLPAQTYRALILTLTLLTNHLVRESIRCGIDWSGQVPDASPTP